MPRVGVFLEEIADIIAAAAAAYDADLEGAVGLAAENGRRLKNEDATGGGLEKLTPPAA